MTITQRLQQKLGRKGGTNPSLPGGPRGLGGQAGRTAEEEAKGRFHFPQITKPHYTVLPHWLLFHFHKNAFLPHRCQECG